MLTAPASPVSSRRPAPAPAGTPAGAPAGRFCFAAARPVGAAPAPPVPHFAGPAGGLCRDDAALLRGAARLAAVLSGAAPAGG